MKLAISNHHSLILPGNVVIMYLKQWGWINSHAKLTVFIHHKDVENRYLQHSNQSSDIVRKKWYFNSKTKLWPIFAIILRRLQIYVCSFVLNKTAILSHAVTPSTEGTYYLLFQYKLEHTLRPTIQCIKCIRSNVCHSIPNGILLGIQFNA